MANDDLVYLTYGDVDSPVFGSQVIGFCRFLEETLEIPTVLVSFVPLRTYFAQRRKIKSYSRRAKVYPVINRWQTSARYSHFNAWLLNRLKANSIMTRSPRAHNVCARLQSQEWNYFYDARGCVFSEIEEFGGANEHEVQAMKDLERNALKSADWVYAVSKALVTHFKTELAYRDHNHSIVPCCVSPGHPETTVSSLHPFSPGVTVFTYAGSLNAWNNPRSFLELCAEILRHPNYRLIILSPQIEEIKGLGFLSNDRCILRSVGQDEVSAYLEGSDYGILLRKKCATNRVASPSKYADYVMSGCKVIISPEVGDISDWTLQTNVGFIYRGRKDNKLLAELKPSSREQRAKIKSKAVSKFNRKSELNLIKYRNLKRLHDGF